MSIARDKRLFLKILEMLEFMWELIDPLDDNWVVFSRKRQEIEDLINIA